MRLRSSSSPVRREEDLVRQVVVGELRLVEGLDEVNVEVALGLCRGPIVRRPEEQVAHAFDTALLPFELVLPDLETGITQVVAALHQRLDGAVVGGPARRRTGLRRAFRSARRSRCPS